jgi:hypothetical protein
VRFLQGGQAGGLGNIGLAPGAFGGPGPGQGTGELSEVQITALCTAREHIKLLDARVVEDYMIQIYAHNFDVSEEIVRDVMQNGNGCDGNPYVPSAAATPDLVQPVAVVTVPAFVPKEWRPVSITVDPYGIPVSSNDVWNACIRDYQLFAAGEVRPLNCRKYHADHTWEHPDTGVSFKWSNRLVQNIKVFRHPVNLVVVEAPIVAVRPMNKRNLISPLTVAKKNLSQPLTVATGAGTAQ